MATEKGACRKRKWSKTGSISLLPVLIFQLRRSPLYIENGANCDCSSLEQTQHLDGSSSSGDNSFLVTGRRQGDRLTVDMIQPFNRRSKELRRAVRALRQSDVCQGQSVIVDVGRTRVEPPAGRGTRRRPRKQRGNDAITMTTTATPVTAERDGGRSRIRQSGSRRNRARNRDGDARQRARAARRDQRRRQ